MPQVRVHRLDANLGPLLTRAEEHAGLATRHFELAISSRVPHSTPSFGVEWGFPRISIIYRVAKTGQRYVTGPSGQETSYYTLQVQKIGQYPPLSITIPKPLENNLGEHHAAPYKKALINRNEGYGLGAVSYMRRVVEDKTEELIEVVAELAEAHNIDAKTVGEIRAAKLEKTTYDQKLRIAATVLPESLLIDGVNPLDVLYGLVSGGLHDLTEEQCIAIADEIRGVFEYTFTRLKAETQDRRDFASKIKKWAGGKKPGAVAATTKPTE